MILNFRTSISGDGSKGFEEIQQTAALDRGIILKKFKSLIIGLGFFTLCLNSFARDFATAKKTRFNIWPQIVFTQGADFSNFDYTISQTRDSVRKQFWSELNGTLLNPMLLSNQDASALAPILAEILLTFDQVHKKHVNDAYEGVSQSLESLLKASFDQQLANFGIREQKVRFSAGPNLSQAIAAAAQAGKTISLEAALEAMTDIDYILYGNVSIASPGYVNITLTLQDYRSGDTRTFTHSGEIQSAITALGQQLFSFFYSNTYEEWINPQPNLKWLPSPPGKHYYDAGFAISFCNSQGARLPYSLELMLAGSLSQYQDGGINLAPNETYIVADKKKVNDQYYFHTDQYGATGGPVRPDGGMSRFWCVKGEPIDNVRYIEGLYKIFRHSKDSLEILKAVRYILNQMQDPAMLDIWPTDFDSISEAENVLRKNGYYL